MWIALEENRCIFAIAVQHWIIHQSPPSHATRNIEASSSTSDDQVIDTTDFEAVQFTVLEHSGTKIVLPPGSQIAKALYASVDDAVVMDVTQAVRKVLKRRGDISATNRIFGDPAKKKQKKLVIDALLPPYTMENEVQPSTSERLAQHRVVTDSTRSHQHDDDIRQITLAEHTWETLQLPDYAEIIFAFYGDADQRRGRDVLPRIQELQAQGKTIYASNKLYGDPVQHVRKFLFIKYILH